MRILVKILLSIAVVIIGVIIQAVISESGNDSTGLIRLLPGAIIIFGIIGVWKYLPKKDTDNRNLDKNV
ncbi:hypothetical protein [Moheibacter sediminis]|uniref:Uncharacterized protein n=1 Tax=Moheibacter sediminis TaxID=1434700 RepID=A0A1W2C7X3_9FLAO|nr:hypothetical protein [Moheibacter sediminis]SMC81240.1 hypothetical protein SAMN06296427_10944 [Moheibacter sediminis]